MEHKENTPENRPDERSNRTTSPREERRPAGRNNIWNLILGIIFLGYGSYRLYYLSASPESETFSYILAVAFVIFGIYDLWKYYKGVQRV
ncbi:hypothetical protein FHG64_16280 [Antarcticibacterium flavum]|uniref:Uncharacterized protein n=1 Tax=Antarcticibacterium flavum TaxID=2058175 RepID=A0A5B7X6T4_9FLAO|nr:MULTISPECIES: hypothetical protein [Antarcticibacterium]MCM4159573.1 hypothetical protein [Antarcticibacterium sp. W02-3]QCY70825.1 hypothetical protein FHG64_16280 [Antarcticibacterium flavum]